MASSKGTRIFGFVILIACLGVIGGGAWFFFGREYFAQDDDVVTDDEPDDVAPGVDAGPHKAGTHHGKRRGGKGNGAAKAPSVAHASPANYGPPGKTYEAAIAGNREQISIGAANGAPDLTDGQLGGPMRNGTFLGACGAPDSMHVTVKVAIREGHAAGVSVYTNPPNPQIASCIDHSVRGLAWPVNGKMDSFVTTY